MWWEKPSLQPGQAAVWTDRHGLGKWAGVAEAVVLEDKQNADWQEGGREGAPEGAGMREAGRLPPRLEWKVHLGAEGGRE